MFILKIHIYRKSYDVIEGVFSYIFFNRLSCFRLNANFMLQMLKKVKLLMIRQKMDSLSFELLRFFISKGGLGTGTSCACVMSI